MMQLVAYTIIFIACAYAVYVFGSIALYNPKAHI